METPLTSLLRACTDEERAALAQKAATSVNYLYNLAGCHRERPGLQIALAIEDASIELNKATEGRTPVVTSRQLATMCSIAKFEG